MHTVAMYLPSGNRPPLTRNLTRLTGLEIRHVYIFVSNPGGPHRYIRSHDFWRPVLEAPLLNPIARTVGLSFLVAVSGSLLAHAAAADPGMEVVQRWSLGGNGGW